MNENQKLEKIKESKNNIESLVNQAQETRDFLHKEKNSSAIKVGKFEATKAREVNTYSSADEAIDHQDVELRKEYIDAVSKDINSKQRVRRSLLWFYIIFISVVSLLIFFVVIDPISLIKGVSSFYPIELKIVLCGAFFANVISVILVMTKYSFSSVDNIMQAFEDLSRKK